MICFNKNTCILLHVSHQKNPYKSVIRISRVKQSRPLLDSGETGYCAQIGFNTAHIDKH